MVGQRGFTAVFFIVVLSLISVGVVTGGYYLKKNYTKPTSKIVATPQPSLKSETTPVSSSTSASTPDSVALELGDPSTWRTYINTKYHYLISYPDIFGTSNYSTPLQLEQEDIAKLSTSYGTKRLSQPLDRRGRFTIYIDGTPRTKKDKPFTCTTNIDCQQELVSYTYVREQTGVITRTILGQPIRGIDSMTTVFLKKIPEDSSPAESVPVNYQYYAFIYQGKPFVIWLSNYFKSPTDLTYINSAYDKILSTLQFDQ